MGAFRPRWDVFTKSFPSGTVNCMEEEAERFSESNVKDDAKEPCLAGTIRLTQG